MNTIEEFKKGDVLIEKYQKFEVVFKCYTTDPTQFKTDNDFQFRVKDFFVKKENKK